MTSCLTSTPQQKRLWQGWHPTPVDSYHLDGHAKFLLLHTSTGQNPDIPYIISKAFGHEAHIESHRLPSIPTLHPPSVKSSGLPDGQSHLWPPPMSSYIFAAESRPGTFGKKNKETSFTPYKFPLGFGGSSPPGKAPSFKKKDTHYTFNGPETGVVFYSLLNGIVFLHYMEMPRFLTFSLEHGMPSRNAIIFPTQNTDLA